jgi:hypothetical protein
MSASTERTLKGADDGDADDGGGRRYEGHAHCDGRERGLRG